MTDASVAGAATPQRPVRVGLRRRNPGASVESQPPSGFALAPGRPPGLTSGRVADRTVSLFVLAFLIGLFIPWVLYIGPLRLSVYRLVLLVALVPCLIMWASGRAGKIRWTDIFVILYLSWCNLSLIVLHGFNVALQPIGIGTIETLGAYFLARCFIRTASDFYNMVRILFIAILCLLPLALFETVTGENISARIFGTVFTVFPDVNYDPRWGLRRVQSVFEHPILFGVCTGSVFAMTFLVLGYGQSFMRRTMKAGLVGAVAFLSLSAGPITAMVAQVALVGWDWILKKNPLRWKVLLAGIAFSWLVISVLSNRSVPAFYISLFSFDQQSAYFRILIWVFGMDSIRHFPLFGVGLGEWLRPSWMPPSIDMFWLIHAIRNGIPAGVFMALIFFTAYLPVAFKKGLPPREDTYRFAYLVAMMGYFVVGWTVHFWNASYVLFLFILGSGIWLLDYKPGQGATAPRNVGGHKSIYLNSPKSFRTHF
jgi:hypothetical protein